MALGMLAYRTDDITEFEKVFNDKVLKQFEDLNKFFENKQYIAGDYLTYVDFMVNERLLLINAFAMKALKVDYFNLFLYQFIFQVNLFEKHANLKKYNENFMNLPKIKEFFGMKEFDLPFSLPMAKFQV